MGREGSGAKAQTGNPEDRYEETKPPIIKPQSVILLQGPQELTTLT